jgi:hypothetical protein
MRLSRIGALVALLAFAVPLTSEADLVYEFIPASGGPALATIVASALGAAPVPEPSSVALLAAAGLLLADGWLADAVIEIVVQVSDLHLAAENRIAFGAHVGQVSAA